MIMWKRLLKWLAWLLSGALLVLVVAYLALLVVNWRDRPPSEDAMRLAEMYQNRPAVSAEDNGYVYAMGFAVARTEDPGAAGIRRIEWLREIGDAAEHSLRGDPAAGSQGYRLARSPAVQSKVLDDQVPAELEASAVRVPYTGEPFGWDAEEGAIVFTGLEPEERGRHAFKH